MALDVLPHGLRPQFVPKRSKGARGDVDGLFDRVKNSAKKCETSGCCASFRLLINRSGDQRPRISVSDFWDLFFERHKRFLTVVQRRLPKTIDAEVIYLGERLREPKIGFIVVK